MRLTLAILGRPPGRALFNVKSRTLLFFYREQDAGTNTNSKTRYGLRKNLLRDTHIPPHTWSLQNFKCMEFKFPSVVVPSSRHIEVL